MSQKDTITNLVAIGLIAYGMYKLVSDRHKQKADKTISRKDNADMQHDRFGMPIAKPEPMVGTKEYSEWIKTEQGKRWLEYSNKLKKGKSNGNNAVPCSIPPCPTYDDIGLTFQNFVQ